MILIDGKMGSWVRVGHVRGGHVMAVSTVREYVQRINGFSCDSVSNLNRKFNPWRLQQDSKFLNPLLLSLSYCRLYTSKNTLRVGDVVALTLFMRKIIGSKCI